MTNKVNIEKFYDYFDVVGYWLFRFFGVQQGYE